MSRLRGSPVTQFPTAGTTIAIGVIVPAVILVTRATPTAVPGETMAEEIPTEAATPAAVIQTATESTTAG